MGVRCPKKKVQRADFIEQITLDYKRSKDHAIDIIRFAECLPVPSGLLQGDTPESCGWDYIP